LTFPRAAPWRLSWTLHWQTSVSALESGTRLRRLALRGSALDLCEFIHQLSTSGVPGGLTSFSLRVHDSSRQTHPHLSEALISLLRRTTNLTEFLGYDLPKDILHTVTSTHGGNICRLRFRRTNYTGLGDPNRPGRSPPALAGSSNYKGCLFTPHELQDLARQVPHLERLGIDLCSVRELVSWHVNFKVYSTCGLWTSNLINWFWVGHEAQRRIRTLDCV
jgi:hypothetical protein